MVVRIMQIMGGNALIKQALMNGMLSAITS